jgi:tetratricopeptide (TPR) repeat protein
LADEAAARFPGNIEAQTECAWVASARHDWEEALQRWTAVVERVPERAEAHIGAIQALRMLGRAGEAEAMARAALIRFPDNTDLMVEHVWAAVAREDWPAAASRLVAARGKVDDARRFAERLGPAENRVRSHLAPAERTGASPAGEPAPSPADLMLSFESLGERCDFGAVQRHFGVEPLGLLRFAFTKYDALIAALDDRFSAVGTAEDTAFQFYKDENIIFMKKYGLMFHTFVYEKELPTEQSREAFHGQQRRRLTFLRDKLIADLEDPQKIYIYSTNERASDAEATRLFAALRRYGPNSLLYVRPATEARPAGTVETLDDGLFVGHFNGLTDFVNGGQPLFELWRGLCEQTYRLSRLRLS